MVRGRGPNFVFEPVNPELKVIYELIKGETKFLRLVRIRGNVSTEDRVIRRRVQLFPGDLMDVTKLDRSRALLDRTRAVLEEEDKRKEKILKEQARKKEIEKSVLGKYPLLGKYPFLLFGNLFISLFSGHLVKWLRSRLQQYALPW